MAAAADESIERAKVLIAERRYADAVRTCRRALLSSPDLADIRMLLGEALLAMERYDEVRVEMMALLRRAPTEARAHRLLGEAFLRVNRTEQAVIALRKALALDPRDDVTRELLAEASDEEVAPASATIERWFADEAQPTAETRVEGFDDDEPTQLGERPDMAELEPPKSFQPRKVAPRAAPPKPVTRSEPPIATKVASPRAIAGTPPKPAPELSPEPLSLDSDELSLDGEATHAASPKALAAGDEHDATEAFARFDDDLVEEDTTAPPSLRTARAKPVRPAAIAPVPPAAVPVAVVSVATPPVVRPKPPPAGMRWVLVIGLGAVAVAIVGVGSGLAISAWSSSNETQEIRQQALVACDTGDRAALEALAARLRGETDVERRALGARILATLVLEHGAERTSEAQAVLTAIGPEPTDARLATAYLLISQDRPQGALQVLSHLPAEGDQIMEGYRARALATSALERTAQAREAAATALRYRPSAPRHLALAALADHLDGHSSQGVARLRPEDDRYPAVRVTRARILYESGSDPARAVQEAEAALAMSASASPFDIAWAHLVLAKSALDRGAAREALPHARAAAERRPPSDERFSLHLADVFLRCDDARAADRQLAAAMPPVDTAARALLEAEIALALGDLDRAERALAAAPDTPRRDLVLGRVLSARARPNEARALYERALAAPGPEGRQARVRLAALALEQNDAARALTLLSALPLNAQGDLEASTLLARAYLALGRLSLAEQTLTGALARQPAAPELSALQGTLQMRQGHPGEALVAFERAATTLDHDADLQVELADAAWAAGEAPRARQAYERALVLSPGQVRAHLGLARLALGEGRFDDAARELAGSSDREAGRLSAELSVRRGDGAAAFSPLQALLQRDDDASNWAWLGWAQAQAEQDDDAGASFREALRRDRSSPEALLGRALLEARGGSPRAVQGALSDAQRAGQRLHLGPQFSARVEAMRGRAEFEAGHFESATEHAAAALRLDPRCGMAHYVLALAAIEQSGDPDAELRLAVQGDTPPAEAMARLALRGTGDEACAMARRYAAAAPHGFDAHDLERRLARCQ